MHLCIVVIDTSAQCKRDERGVGQAARRLRARGAEGGATGGLSLDQCGRRSKAQWSRGWVGKERFQVALVGQVMQFCRGQGSV